ncbi:MAG: hypothetical protein K2I21_00185 [Acetatifactor sp.]|nr:hypothetical protein [Acetatifactor sp.]
MGRKDTTGHRIGLFSLGLLLCGLMGFAGSLLGVRLAQQCQPQPIRQESEEPSGEQPDVSADEAVPRWHNQVMEAHREDGEEVPAPVISIPETLNAETEYILREKDLLSGSEVELSEDIPDMYIGMNREQFLSAMENYEAAPPLSEKERGFVSLDVLSFAPSRVVVQMNYRYVQPSKSFYVVAINDLIVVYLEDRQTVYQYTNIRLSQLPEQLQQEIIGVMHVTDEESLYDFLENYTS